MNKEELLELRDLIFKEWDNDCAIACGGMPSGPSRNDDWYKKMTEIAESLGK